MTPTGLAYFLDKLLLLKALTLMHMQEHGYWGFFYWYFTNTEQEKQSSAWDILNERLLKSDITNMQKDLNSIQDLNLQFFTPMEWNYEQ